MSSLPEPLKTDQPTAPQRARERAGTIAPAWHTLVLIAGIAAVSIAGMMRPAHPHSSSNRLLTYATTAALELMMLGWVMLGLRLRKLPLRTLFGTVPTGWRPVMRDVQVAILFWFGSMIVLGGLGAVWTRVEARVTHQQLSAQSGKLNELTPSERRATKEMEQIAPANGEEIACWVMLCAVAGFVEESVFRGYLQSQFTAWAHGAAAAGVVFSAIMFGAAHGYQGARNMTLLAVFGVLFSLLALRRRNLRACILAHGWHDLVAGLALGMLRSHHVM